MPRTNEGKAVSKSNRITHGLTSTEILIPGEARQDWQRFHDAVVESLHPEPGAESQLASRVAELMWRIRRVAVAEAEFVEHEYQHDERAALRDEWIKRNAERVRAARAAAVAADPSVRQPEVELLDALIDPTPTAAGDAPVTGFYAPVLAANNRFPPPPPGHTLPNADNTERIIRYEAHVSRQLYAALNQLEAMQNLRTGRAAPIARVQVSGLPGS